MTGKKRCLNRNPGCRQIENESKTKLAKNPIDDRDDGTRQDDRESNRDRNSRDGTRESNRRRRDEQIQSAKEIRN